MTFGGDSGPAGDPDLQGEAVGGAGGRAGRVGLVRELGELLRELAVASDGIAHRFAARHDLHANDFQALTLIYAADRAGDPLTPGRLAAQVHLTSAAVTYLVERLVASGHVVRADDPRDRRRVILRYAVHGHEVASSYFGPLGAHLGVALADFGDDELRTATAVLAVMRDAMVGYDAPVKP